MIRITCKYKISSESRILLMDHKYTPPPLFLIFCLFQVRLDKGKVCPAGLGKRFGQGSAELEPPAGARIRKKRKSKIRGGGYLCSKCSIRESPTFPLYLSMSVCPSDQLSVASLFHICLFFLGGPSHRLVEHHKTTTTNEFWKDKHFEVKK